MPGGFEEGEILIREWYVGITSTFMTKKLRTKQLREPLPVDKYQNGEYSEVFRPNVCIIFLAPAGRREDGTYVVIPPCKTELVIAYEHVFFIVWAMHMCQEGLLDGHYGVDSFWLRFAFPFMGVHTDTSDHAGIFADSSLATIKRGIRPEACSQHSIHVGNGDVGVFSEGVCRCKLVKTNPSPIDPELVERRYSALLPVMQVEVEKVEEKVL